MSQTRLERYKRKMFQKTINLERANREMEAKIRTQRAEITTLQRALDEARAAAAAKA